MASTTSVFLGITTTSPLWDYKPTRDGPMVDGWNAGYSGDLPRTSGEGHEANGTPLRRTRHAGSTIDFAFSDKILKLCYTTNGTDYDILFDNQPLDLTQHTESAANSEECKAFSPDVELVATIPNPDKGNHQIQLVTRNARNRFIFWGGAIYFDVNQAFTVETIDDLNDQWQYGPDGRGDNRWDVGKGPNLNDGASTFNCQYSNDTTATIQFTDAIAFVLEGSVWPDAHSFSIDFNGKTLNLDPTITWMAGRTMLYFQHDLDATKTYSLVVRNFRADDPDCRATKACCIAIDALQLMRPNHGTGTDAATMLPSMTLGPGQDGNDDDDDGASANVTAVVGGAVGGIVLLALVGVLAFCFLRRCRRGRRPRNDGFEIDSTAYSLGPTASSHNASTNLSEQEQLIDPYTQTPGSVPVSSGIVGGFAVRSTGDRKNPSTFRTHSSHQRQGSAAERESLLASGDHNVQPTSMAPSESRHSRPSHGSDGGSRLTQADMEHVLQFVAARMDAPPAQSPSKRTQRSAIDDSLPTYVEARR